MPATTILDCIGGTPLVQLTRIGAGLSSPILAKCEFLNPGGSVKDRIAKAIVEDAESQGLLKPGSTLIEATAGNTGVGLAMMAARRGYRLVCVMPEKMCHDKRVALQALGAEVIITDNAPPGDPRNFRQLARRLAEQHGWFHSQQFEHPANPRIHELTTGPEIWEQCHSRIGAFVCGAGTGGTITGAGRFLKRKNPTLRVILADPHGSRLAHLVNKWIPDFDSSYQIEGIGGSEAPSVLDLSIIDDAVQISDEESFAMTRRLLREEGLLVGGSSGTAVAAALQVARESSSPLPIVTVLPDSWDRYFSKSWLQECSNPR